MMIFKSKKERKSLEEIYECLSESAEDIGAYLSKVRSGEEIISTQEELTRKSVLTKEVLEKVEAVHFKAKRKKMVIPGIERTVNDLKGYVNEFDEINRNYSSILTMGSQENPRKSRKPRKALRRQ